MGLEDKKKKILAEKYFAFWKVFVLDRRRKHSLESKTKILDNKLSKFVNNLCISEINNIPTYSKHQRFTPCYDDNVQKDNRHYKGEIFENRLIAQKQMIVQQKALISEQVRVINELKSKQEVRIVVDSFVEEVEHVNHIKANKVHKVLLKPGDHPLIKRMKEREEDRKYHRALFEMKKKEREKYIAEKLIEDEKQRKLLEAESKRQKAREKREGERRLKEEEVRKRADKEYCRKLAAAAEVLRDRLTVHRAMSLWKEQVDRSKESMKRRLKMLKKVIVQTHFRLWRASVVIVRTSVTHAASNLGNLILVRNCWRIWALQAKKSLAVKAAIKERTERHISIKYFKKWRLYIRKSVETRNNLIVLAHSIYSRVLKMEVFRLWRKLPGVMFRQREEAKRLRQWEIRVKSVLPDYKLEMTTGANVEFTAVEVSTLETQGPYDLQRDLCFVSRWRK